MLMCKFRVISYFVTLETILCVVSCNHFANYIKTLDSVCEKKTIMSFVAGARSLYGGSEETFDLVCDPCNYRGIQREGTSYCSKCQEKLCKSCADAHNGQKITRDHNLVPVSKLTKALPIKGSTCMVLCDCRQNSGVSIFCQDHDDVVCQSCAVIKHRACKTFVIREKIASYPKDHCVAVTLIAEQLNDETDKVLHKRKSDLRTYSTMTDTIKGDMQTFRQDINRQFDIMEQTILTELDARKSRNQHEVDGHISSCTTTKQMIQTDLKILDDAKKSDDEADMFAADVQVSKRLAEYEGVLREIQRQTKMPNLIFRKNGQLLDMLTNMKNIGTLVEEAIEKEPNKGMVLNELKVKSRSKTNVRMSSDEQVASITGCVFMPDDRVILCDRNNNKLKLLAKSFKLQDSLDLPSYPFDISVVNDTTVITTMPEMRQLQYIEVARRLKLGRDLKLNKMCYGIQVAGGNIFITCRSGMHSDDGEVRIIDSNGNLRNRLGVNLITRASYLTVSARSNKIYVSDVDEDAVTCLKSDGTFIFKYNDPELKSPCGLFVDDEDNVLVCGEDPKNMHKVSAIGRKTSVILTAKDGIKEPISVAYRQTDNTLIVGCFHNDNICVIKCVVK